MHWPTWSNVAWTWKTRRYELLRNTEGDISKGCHYGALSVLPRGCHEARSVRLPPPPPSVEHARHAYLYVGPGVGQPVEAQGRQGRVGGSQSTRRGRQGLLGGRLASETTTQHRFLARVSMHPSASVSRKTGRTYALVAANAALTQRHPARSAYTGIVLSCFVLPPTCLTEQARYAARSLAQGFPGVPYYPGVDHGTPRGRFGRHTYTAPQGLSKTEAAYKAIAQTAGRPCSQGGHATTLRCATARGSTTVFTQFALAC